jgi:hypothetical protein
MRIRTVLIAIGVVVVLIAAYWAFVGFGEAVDDFSPSDNFSGTDTTATYIKYATFAVAYDINPYNGLYSGTQPTQGLGFSSITIMPTVKQFVSMSEGTVYHQNQLKFDWGGENSGGTGSPMVTVNYYAVLSVTGPSNYKSDWTLETRGYSNPQATILHYSFTSGRAFFATPGTYTATVTFYQYIGGVPTSVSVSHDDFGVNL